MTPSTCRQRKYLAGCIIIFLLMTFTEEFASSLPVVANDATRKGISEPHDPPSKPTVEPHNKPSEDTAKTAAEFPENPLPGSLSTSAQRIQPDALQPNAQQSDAQQTQQDNNKLPVGTAVAPQEKAYGTPASRPAGAVIAPAKQHRARFLLIRVGAIAGAAIAIGTVVLLSSASPSRSH